MCVPTRADEHAVSMLTAGPVEITDAISFVANPIMIAAVISTVSANHFFS